MPLEAQTRLLRVLQQGEYTTVGGRVPIKTDVRIIAATNRDLRQLIQQGLFREDLFYRLNVVPMRLPPLRERVEDIPDLVRHFLRKAEADGLPPKRLEPAAIERLKIHTWPGNVRELENLVRRLVVLTPDEVILEEAVSSEMTQLERTMPAAEEEKSLTAMVERYLAAHFAEYGARLPPAGLYDRVVREVERPLIATSLAAARGNQIRAAQLLGVNRNTLRKKIRELNIEVIRGLKSP
jgi:two-component system nitrogen regulation response regulator GlnG